MEIKKIEKQRAEETFDVEVDFGGRTIKVWVKTTTFKWFDGETHKILESKFNGFDKLKKSEKKQIRELINSKLLENA